MNYRWHYDRLIETRRQRERVEGQYYERHHVIMRSMGGDNSDENLVYLTAREHFVAHRLLIKIFPNRKTTYAFVCLCKFLQKRSSFIPSSRSFEEARLLYSTLGHSPETRLKISLSNRGVKRSDETCEKIGNSNRGRKFTEESLYKMRKPHKSFSEETKIKMSNSRVGVKHSQKTITKLKKPKSSEHKQKLSESKKKEYIFYKQDDLMHIANGQADAINYCKTVGLPYSIMIKQKFYKEWKIIQKKKEM